MVNSPDSIVEQVFRAVAERRYADVAEFVDPDDVAALYEQALVSATHVQEAQPRSASDYIQLQPDLPLAVAEYFATRDAEQAAHGSFLPFEYADVKNAADIERLSPADLLARWIQAHDPLYQLQRHASAQNPPLPVDYLDRYPVPEVQRTVIGSVMESDDLAHVVYRISFGGESEGEPKVASLRRRPTGWRMRFNHEFLGHGNWGFGFGSEEPVDSDPRRDS